MKNMFNRLFLMTVLAFLSGFMAYGQKYSNEFLSIGVGARAQGMGNAQVASVNDVSAAFWNPAALAQISFENGIQLGAMHNEWFAGVGKYDYLGVGMPFSNSKKAFGLTAIRFGIDDIPNTLSLYDDNGAVNYDNVVPFSAADYGFLMTYAQHVFTQKGKLYVGGNVKVVHRKIGPFANSWGFGLDAAVLWHVKNWRFAFMGKDITNTFNAWRFNFTDQEKEVLEFTNNVIPINSLEVTRPQFILGAAYNKQWEKFGIEAELDFTVTTDGYRNTLIQSFPFSADPQMGFELNYKKFIFLRGGVNNFQRETDIGVEKFWTFQPNLGVGVKVFKLRIDYAYADIDDRSKNTYSHIISLVLDLDFGYFKNSMNKSKK